MNKFHLAKEKVYPPGACLGVYPIILQSVPWRTLYLGARGVSYHHLHALRIGFWCKYGPPATIEHSPVPQIAFSCLFVGRSWSEQIYRINSLSHLAPNRECIWRVQYYPLCDPHNFINAHSAGIIIKNSELKKFVWGAGAESNGKTKKQQQIIYSRARATRFSSLSL